MSKGWSRNPSTETGGEVRSTYPPPHALAQTMRAELGPGAGAVDAESMEERKAARAAEADRAFKRAAALKAAVSALDADLVAVRRARDATEAARAATVAEIRLASVVAADMAGAEARCAAADANALRLSAQAAVEGDATRRKGDGNARSAGLLGQVAAWEVAAAVRGGESGRAAREAEAQRLAAREAERVGEMSRADAADALVAAEALRARSKGALAAVPPRRAVRPSPLVAARRREAMKSEERVADRPGGWTAANDGGGASGRAAAMAAAAVEGVNAVAHQTAAYQRGTWAGFTRNHCIYGPFDGHS